MTTPGRGFWTTQDRGGTKGMLSYQPILSVFASYADMFCLFLIYRWWSGRWHMGRRNVDGKTGQGLQDDIGSRRHGGQITLLS